MVTTINIVNEIDLKMFEKAFEENKEKVMEIIQKHVAKSIAKSMVNVLVEEVMHIKSDKKCEVCEEPSSIEFRVSDELYEIVTKDENRDKLLCLKCFDSIARDTGIKLRWNCSVDSFKMGSATELKDTDFSRVP